MVPKYIFIIQNQDVDELKYDFKNVAFDSIVLYEIAWSSLIKKILRYSSNKFDTN